MSEAAANSKEKNEIEVSKTILPENKKYESESLNYLINIPDWLLKDIHNFEKSNKENYENQNLIVKAFKLAYKAHDGQFRASGEPYIIHPVAVANLLKEIGASSSVIAAGRCLRRALVHRWERTDRRCHVAGRSQRSSSVRQSGAWCSNPSTSADTKIRSPPLL